MPAPTVTPAEVQTALGDGANDPKILHALQTTESSTEGAYYVHGRGLVKGRVRWCPITNTDTASTQAAAILVSLRA